MKRTALMIAVIATMMLVLPTAALASDAAASWGEFKAALEKAATQVKTNPTAAALETARAQGIYDQKILPEITAEKSARAVVLAAIVDANAAAKRGDALGLEVATEKAEKTMLGLFLPTFENKLKNQETASAREWFDIIATQLKFPATADMYGEMKAVEANPKLAGTEGKEIVGDFVAKIVDKVSEEVDEAIVAGDPKNKDKDLGVAQVKAAEGLGYFEAGEAKITEKLGFEDTARIAGVLEKVGAALVDGDWETAEEAADVAKRELAEVETTKKISGSAFVQQVAQIKAGLTAAAKEANDGKMDDAKKLADDAWTGFTRVESQVREIDPANYVKIEKLFGQVKEGPKAADMSQLSELFAGIAAIESGQKKAARVTTTETILTSFERVQPILFALLALLGVYPIYLITRAFGWRHKAWRNIGIFIILLIIPVFMEALGRLGVEMKIQALQALSFTVSEWAKMAWTLIVLAAFLFAINGLRAFCAQFGIKAIGVRIEEQEPISYDDQHAEVLEKA